MKAINYPLLLSIGIAIFLHHVQGQMPQTDFSLSARPTWTLMR